MKVLSLYDGMACGMLAMQRASIPVDDYYAYEIDKYAVKTVQHNFPGIQELGDVFREDYTKYEGQIDYLIGGSPCTYWSIAQSPDKRETTSSGVGWDLFSQYVRALQEAKPKYFIYENNKSMARAIYEAISETFGFEPIMINSALVSAQNRQRYYWVGKRNADGTYSKVDVEQPEDRGILLKDVLDGFAIKEKSPVNNICKYSSTYGASGVAEPVAINTFNNEGRKSRTVMSGYYKYGEATILTNKGFKGGTTAVAEPVCVASRGRYSDTGSRTNKTDAPTYQHYEARTDGKTNAITTVSKDNLVGKPVRVCAIDNHQGNRIYSVDGKSICLEATGGGLGGQTGLYAMPIEFDGDIPIKAVSGADGKTYTVYEVKDGTITIKGKTYPIKLVDGYYIIRKLTVSECKRLQTVPEWYEFPVSDTQAYKMLGNGWTVEVIAHLINATKNT